MKVAENILLLVFDGFADWEPTLACAELNKSARFRVQTIGFTGSEVRSMAGLRIVPDHSLDTLRVNEAALLLLPGGDLWEVAEQPEISSLLTQFEAAARPIATICGATIAAAHAGLLNDRAHTSNFPGYIDQHAASYTGRAHYQEQPAVTDRGVITASGMGSVEFAFEILQLLNIYGAEDLALWLTIFRDKIVPAELRV